MGDAADDVLEEEVPSTPPMEGYLYKRGAINKAFKRRFFRHTGSDLVYSTSEEAKKAQGKVDLTCVITVEMEDSRDCPAGAPGKVLVLVTAKRRWVLAADDEATLQAWCKRLSRAVADVSPVATNNIQNVLAERQEKELRALSAEASLNTRSLTDVALGELPLAVEPGELVFGDARQIPIDQRTEHVLKLTNTARDKVSFRFYGNNDRTRYRLELVPSQGTLARGASLEVRCAILPLCTARVHDKLSVLVWRGPLKALASAATRVYHARVDMGYESLLSTKLDALELKMYDPIGEGGYGVVRRGQYRGLDVAVKSLKLDDVADVLEDFRREVGFLELLRHPNIVNYIGSLHTPTKLAIVTEYCRYGNLCTALAGREHGEELSLAFRIRCLQDTARAMDFLHQSNIMHRDLKPQNILVVSLEPGSAAVAKITDFGTVRDLVTVQNTRRSIRRDPAAAAAPTTAAAVGSCRGEALDAMTRGVGTTAYMAPEVLGNSKYEKPADVYSFSMIVYFICTGIEPYSAERDIPVWRFTKLVAEGKRPAVPPAVPPEYAALLGIMKRCWDQEPSVRPSFKELVDEFEAMPLPAPRRAVRSVARNGHAASVSCLPTEPATASDASSAASSSGSTPRVRQKRPQQRSFTSRGTKPTAAARAHNAQSCRAARWSACDDDAAAATVAASGGGGDDAVVADGGGEGKTAEHTA